MKLNRRHVMAGGAVAGLALLGESHARAQQKATRPKATLKLASQEGIIPGKDLKEKVGKMEQWGFDGLEVWGGGLPNRVKEIRDALNGSKIRLCAVCAGYGGALASDQEAERQKAFNDIKDLLSAAGELNSTGLIIVPAFNGQTKLDNREARKILLDQLPALGDHATKAGTRLLLEPLNRGEAFFLRQLADGAAICRDANRPGICLMGDFYHMGIEEPNDMGAFVSAKDYLHHVHLASRKRNLPGQDERDFRDGFRGLKMIGFNDYCSLECGVVGDRETEIPKAVKFLRRQWSEA